MSRNLLAQAFALLGLGVSPWMLGGVHPLGQALPALCFAASLALGDDRRPANGLLPRWAWVVLVLIFLLPVVPLPASWVGVISPERLKLDRELTPAMAGPSAWLTLSVAPGRSLVRLWDWVVAFAGFAAFRVLGARRASFRLWISALAILVILQFSAELQHQAAGGGNRLLGIWEVSWGTGAGTFANRNHYAHWLAVAGVPCLIALAGWRWQRTAERAAVPATPRWLAGAAGVAAILGVGWSGSRGGFLALILGVLTGIGLLLVVATHRSARVRMALWTGVLGVAILGAGGVAMGRISAELTRPSEGMQRGEVWVQALPVLSRFPFLGSGPGTFSTVFNHYKTGGGDVTVLHAENEYLQWMMENGLAGTILAVAILGALLRRTRERFLVLFATEPVVLASSCGALAAVAFHASIEFVFRIPATFLLCAATCGFLFGRMDRLVPVVPASRIPREAAPESAAVRAGATWKFRFLLLLLVMVAVLQAGAGFQSSAGMAAVREGRLADGVAALGRAVVLWPVDVTRQIPLLRARVLLAERGGGRPANLRATLNAAGTALAGALRWDPFHWEARWELAWLLLSYDLDPRLGLAEAHRVVRLNRLQPALPLRLARFFATRDDRLAREALAMIPITTRLHLLEALAVAWQIEPSPPLLWATTPAVPWGYLGLGEFALTRKQFGLAATAFARLSPEAPEREPAAQALLNAGEPRLALGVLAARQGRSAQVIAAGCRHAMGEFPAVIREAERVLGGRTASAILREESDRWSGPKPDWLVAAVAEAGKPPALREISLVRDWAGRPGAGLAAWTLVFETALGRQDFAAASAAGVEVIRRR